MTTDTRRYACRYQGPRGVRQADTDRAGALAFLTANGAPWPSLLVRAAELDGMASAEATDGGLVYLDTEPTTDDTES